MNDYVRPIMTRYLSRQIEERLAGKERRASKSCILCVQTGGLMSASGCFADRPGCHCVCPARQARNRHRDDREAHRT